MLNLLNVLFDNYFCRIKDKRSGELSENVGHSTIRSKTQEEVKKEEVKKEEPKKVEAKKKEEVKKEEPKKKA